MYFKNRNSLPRTFSLLMISFLFASSALFAQQPAAQDAPDYSDEELENFVKAVLEVMPLQQESQALMIDEIEEEGLTVEAFNKMLEAQQKGVDPEVTEEEMEAFENALLAIQEIELEYNKKITDIIDNTEISPAKYEEIMGYYQQDPELQMKVNQIMEEMDDE